MKFEVIIRDASIKEIQQLFQDTPIKQSAGHGKMQIPFSSVHESAKYQAAVRLCKKHGLPYPAALQSHTMKTTETIMNKYQDTRDTKSQPHWKEVIKKSVHPDHTPRINEGDAP